MIAVSASTAGSVEIGIFALNATDIDNDDSVNSEMGFDTSRTSLVEETLDEMLA
jgi:hypothetical protein